nr:MAG TPA: hypothetical protein [Caudoviricetes sp.]
MNGVLVLFLLYFQMFILIKLCTYIVCLILNLETLFT